MLEEAKVKSPSAFKNALWLLSALKSQTEYQWIPPWSRALGANTAVLLSLGVQFLEHLEQYLL